MKHIGFDESAVLNEYARIANKRGIVKVAAEPARPATADLGVQYISSVRQELQRAGATGALKSIETWKIPPGTPPAELQKTLLRHFSRVPEALAVIRRLKTADLGVQYISSVRQELQRAGATGALKSIETWKIPPGTPPAELQKTLLRHFSRVPEALAVIRRLKTNAELKTNEMAKTADGKLYDISGETGEQLIDSAHPGGGTRTELSSKTDENLVETIVEQQKRDVEVAKSIPKGTYAMLVKLHDRLSKMGHGDELSSLRDAILRISSTKDIISGTLVGLSDRLDRFGYEKSANCVDTMLKSALDLGDIARGVTTLGYGPMLRSVYENWWGPVAGSLTNILDRLDDLDPREGSNMSRKIPLWTQQLNRYSTYFQKRDETGDPVKDKATAKVKLGELNRLLSLLHSYRSEFAKAAQAGEFSDLWSDVSEANSALGTAIKDTSARIDQITKQFPVVEKKLDEAAAAAEERGTAAKTQRKETKRKKGIKDLLTDYRFAMNWAKAFNRVLSKVDPQSKVRAIHQDLSITTGDPVARRARRVIGPFRKTLINAIKYWKSAGRWKRLEKYVREQFKDELAEAYGEPGVAGITGEPVLGSRDRVNEIFRSLIDRYNEVLRATTRTPRFPPLRRGESLHRIISSMAQNIARKESRSENKFDEDQLQQHVGYSIETLGKEDPSKIVVR